MKNNKLKKILIASIILFVVTGLTKVILCSSMAVKSAQLAELSTKKQDLQKQVSKLLFEESRLSNLKLWKIRPMKWDLQIWRETS